MDAGVSPLALDLFEEHLGPRMECAEARMREAGQSVQM